MPHIASTLSAPVTYVEYEYTPDKRPVRKRGITIKGGAGVASRPHALANGLLTPDGIVTPVTEEELAFLKTDEVFQRHIKGGFLKILNSNVSGNKAAKDMNARDPSRPYTEKDYEKGGRGQGDPNLSIKSGSIT